MLLGAPGATPPGASVYAVYGCGAGQRWYSRVRHKTRRMVFPLVCIGLRVRQLPALSLPPSCTHNTRRGCLRGSHTAARPSTCHMRRGVQAHTREKVRLARGFQRPIREKVRPTLPLQQHFREKTRPASRKTPILGCFQRAGRTFSRSHPHQAARGELFRAYTHVRPSRANFFAQKLLAARRDETVNTNAGTSARLRETRDAFAHQDGAENGCFCLAMVPSVSPKTEYAPAKVMTVSHSYRPHRLVTAQAGSPKSRT